MRACPTRRQRRALRRPRQRLARRRHRPRHAVRRLGQRPAERRRRAEHGRASRTHGTDTNPSYEDLAYGGAGRDVLIANTGGDRLIDWIGEFNSYLVPFAPFGMPTVSRTNQPQLPEFLYALSLSDGADPFIARTTAATRPATASRSASSASSRQQDAAWGDQHGSAARPAGRQHAGRQARRPRAPRASGRSTRPAPIRRLRRSSRDAGARRADRRDGPFVSSDDQTLAPLVVTGAIGAIAAYTLSSGAGRLGGGIDRHRREAVDPRRRLDAPGRRRRRRRRR